MKTLKNASYLFTILAFLLSINILYAKEQAETTKDKLQVACSLTLTFDDSKVKPNKTVTYDDFQKHLTACNKTPDSPTLTSINNMYQNLITLNTYLEQLTKLKKTTEAANLPITDIKNNIDEKTALTKKIAEYLVHVYKLPGEKSLLGINIDDPKMLRVINIYKPEVKLITQKATATAKKQDGQDDSDCHVALKVIEPGKNTSIKNYLDKTEIYIKKCEEQLPDAIVRNDTNDLETRRKAANKSIENLKTSVNFGLSIGKPLTATEVVTSNIKSKHQIERLEELIDKNANESLLANWRSEPLTYQFYLGYEGSKTEQISQNSNITTGMMVYFRPGKKLSAVRKILNRCNSDKARPEDQCWYNKLVWYPHLFFSANYSSLAEQAQVNGSNSGLVWEVGAFWPWYYGARAGDSGEPYKTEFMLGPIFTRGGSDVPGQEDFADRYYTGIRLAFNEETYFDVLYGRSDVFNQGIKNQARRFEARGQLPVSELGGGRVFLGGRINIGHKDGSKGVSPKRDAYNFYIKWQTSFDALWARSGE
ncbi:hypothetical protein [Paraglaciecola sp.]|uniref:hypothetical protein n=1 Tax=Paraglaciecola sp. TaxID=1920173 RepID=UPI003EFA7CFC